MSTTQARCLILACGNSVRGDDGVGPWLARWAEKRFAAEAGVRVISEQQWTPDLAEEAVRAQAVLFIDCSLASPPGSVAVEPVELAAIKPGLTTHHLNAAELLAVGREFYSSLPSHAFMLTVGAGAIDLSEEFSEPVKNALPAACQLIEETVLRMMASPAR